LNFLVLPQESPTKKDDICFADLLIHDPWKKAEILRMFCEKGNEMKKNLRITRARILDRKLKFRTSCGTKNREQTEIQNRFY
jgi:hypothetical protein